MMMKLKKLSFTICALLFFFHCALSQPLEFDNDLSNLENLLKDSYRTHPKSNSFQQFKKEKKIGVLAVPNHIPAGYNEFLDCANFKTAYKFHETKKTWTEAAVSCHQEGGYLGYPDCAAEGSTFHHILKRANSGGAWIGVHDLLEKGRWTTLFNKNLSELDYVNWANGEPNNFNDNEDCAEIYIKDGKWYDTECDNKLFYFCKIDIYV